MATTPTGESGRSGVEATGATGGGHGDRVADVSAARLTGLGAFGAATGIVITIAMQFTVPPPASTAATSELAFLAEYASFLELGNKAYFLIDLSLIVLFVGLAQVFPRRNVLARLGVASGLIGVVLFVLVAIVFEGKIALASEYVGAGDAVQQALLGSFLALDRVELIAGVIAHYLAWGIGVAAFAVAILRTSILSRWVGWLGLVFGLLGWLNLPRLVTSSFDPVVLLINVVGVVWLVAVGVGLLRLDPEHAHAVA